MKSRRLRDAAWSAIAAFLALLAPQLVFATHHSYDLWSPEAAVVVFVAGAVSLGVGVLGSWGGGVLRAIAFAALLLVCAELVLDFAALGWRLRWVAVALAGSCWLVRRELPKVLVAVFLVFDATTLAAPRLASPVTATEGATRSDLPLLVHLVLDSHEGLDALGGGSHSAPDLREELLGEFERRGFRIYGAAYSHYFRTRDSLSNLFNFTASARIGRYFANDRASRLLDNEYFRRLARRGYRLRVIQSSWVDFCSDPTLPAVCTTYPNAGLDAIEQVDAGAWCKALLLERILVQRSTFGRWLQRELPAVWKGMIRAHLASCGGALPEWLLAARDIASVASVSGLEVLDGVAAEVRRASGGTAVIAHVILPHAPFVFRADCSRYPPPEWLERGASGAPHNDAASAAVRLDRYQEQVRCLHRRLGTLLDELAARSPPAWVVLHGDHGSRVVSREPQEQELARPIAFDLVHGFSTWFAVKAPHVRPGYDPNPLSLEELLLATVVETREPVAAGTPRLFFARRGSDELTAVAVPEWSAWLGAAHFGVPVVAANVGGELPPSRERAGVRAPP